MAKQPNQTSRSMWYQWDEGCNEWGIKFINSDGWWDEEAKDGENGWIIGDKNVNSTDEEDAESIYNKLENEIIPLWENDKLGWTTMMKNAIATSSVMTAERMVKEYEEYYNLFSKE